MIRVIANENNSARAQTLIAELRQAGFPADTGIPAQGDTLLAVLQKSDIAIANSPLMASLHRAFDLSLHIIIVRLEDFPLPNLINHLTVVDLFNPNHFDVLRAELETLAAPNAPLPVRVLTPQKRRSNRSTGIIVATFSLVMFVAGLYGVGVLGIRAPVAEYNEIDTQVALTRDVLIGPELEYFSTWIPRSTEDAIAYEATLRQLPTAYRPLMGLTVTAYANLSNGTPFAATATPQPATPQTTAGTG